MKAILIDRNGFTKTIDALTDSNGYPVYEIFIPIRTSPIHFGKIQNAVEEKFKRKVFRLISVEKNETFKVTIAKYKEYDEY